jgi:hypothetical protein
VRVPRAAVFAIGRVSELRLGLVKKKSPVAPYRLQSALALRTFDSRRARGAARLEAARGVREGIRRVQAGHAMQRLETP